jgi:hypothetical protein
MYGCYALFHKMLGLGAISKYWYYIIYPVRLSDILFYEKVPINQFGRSTWQPFISGTGRTIFVALNNWLKNIWISTLGKYPGRFLDLYFF